MGPGLRRGPELQLRSYDCDWGLYLIFELGLESGFSEGLWLGVGWG